VHRNIRNIPIYIQKDTNLHSLFYLETALHVSSEPPPIIKSANNCIYSIWYFVTPLRLSGAIVVELNWSEYALGGVRQVHSLFYLEIALYISNETPTHHQERKHLYLQHLVFVTPLLLSAAIVEELELVSVCCGWRTPRCIFLDVY
jgi:hypothetical protein